MSLYKDIVKVNDLMISEEAKELQVKRLIQDMDMNSARLPDNIQLASIQFLDFRLFRNAELNFAFPLTVLVGVNGKGKSSILDAIAHHLSWLIARTTKTKGTGSSLFESDISNVSSRGDTAQILVKYKIGAEIVVGSEEQKSGNVLNATLVAKKTLSASSVSSNLEGYTQYGEVVRVLKSATGSINLPLLASYGVERTCLMRKKNRSSDSFFYNKINQASVFQSALTGTKSFQPMAFTEWFASLSKMSENAANLEKRQKANKSIFLMKSVLKSVVPGFQNIRLDQGKGADEIFICIDNSEVNFEQLSDGQRLFIALVADIVWRLIELNPVRDCPLNGHGIVLIDEIELHLHPTWQQIILPALIRAFPGLQFIVTTHSPQVVSTVPSDAVRLLNNDSGSKAKVIYTKPEVETKGRQSGDVLSEVMQTHPRPNIEEKRWLSDCYRLILSGRNEKNLEVARLLKKIQGHFGQSSIEYQSLSNLARQRAREN